MKSSFKLSVLLLFVFLSWNTQAQEVSGGFKTGLNFSRFDGELIEDANGNSLESFDYATGFHVGAIINVKFTDYFGLRSEILYSQKGTDYVFNGPSFVRLYSSNGNNNLIFSGDRNTTINISNSYIDIPIMAYLRLGRIEFAGGVSAGVLLGSRATGELSLRNVRTPVGQPLDDFIITVDASYFQDEYQINDFSEFTTVNVQNGEFILPSIVGAYFDANDTDDNLFRRLDLGLNAQVGFYLNQGLFLSFRLNYGLTDITNQEQDVDYTDLPNSGLRFRDDADRNISLQTSIGFSF